MTDIVNALRSTFLGDLRVKLSKNYKRLIELDGLPSTVMPPLAVTLTFDLLTQYVSWRWRIGEITRNDGHRAV